MHPRPTASGCKPVSLRGLSHNSCIDNQCLVQTVLGIAQETLRSIRLNSTAIVFSAAVYPPAHVHDTCEHVFVLSIAATMGFASRLSTGQLSPHVDSIHHLLEAMSLYIYNEKGLNGEEDQLKLTAIELWTQSLKCGIVVSSELDAPDVLDALHRFLQCLLDRNEWSTSVKSAPVFFELIGLRGTPKVSTSDHSVGTLY